MYRTIPVLLTCMLFAGQVKPQQPCTQATITTFGWGPSLYYPGHYYLLYQFQAPVQVSPIPIYQVYTGTQSYPTLTYLGFKRPSPIVVRQCEWWLLSGAITHSSIGTVASWGGPLRGPGLGWAGGQAAWLVTPLELYVLSGLSMSVQTLVLNPPYEYWVSDPVDIVFP